MYPFFRLGYQFWRHRGDPPLGISDTHISHHICWPWDLDPWRELNNGRTLTLYDLGRLPLAKRVGLIALLRKQRWGLTMAGATVRYRRRVRMFERLEMRSRCVGWDARFIYLEQSMWSKGECASHILYRAAFTGKNGIVPSAEVIKAAGFEGEIPELPAWVTAWIAADATRPWPPQM